MSITKSVYERLLREYDEKQLAARRDLRLRTQKIEQELPQISAINSRIAEMSVDLAVRRIRGSQADMTAYEEEKQALIRQRDAILEAAGYSARDLEPHYVCSICQDTGFVGDQKCRCLVNRLIDILYDQSNIKEILQKENFSTWSRHYYSDEPLEQADGESAAGIARKAVVKALQFVEHFGDSEENLFISGDTGTGKTFLSNCIAKEILDRGYSVIYLSAARFFRLLADDTFGRGEEPGLTTDLYSCDLLIIDDLGTEFTNNFVQSAFFDCINERLIRRKHTIISTNLSMAQIRDNYSERVFSRLAEKYTLIRLLGRDIRIIKKLEE